MVKFLDGMRKFGEAAFVVATLNTAACDPNDPELKNSSAAEAAKDGGERQLNLPNRQSSPDMGQAPDMMEQAPDRTSLCRDLVFGKGVYDSEINSGKALLGQFDIIKPDGTSQPLQPGGYAYVDASYTPNTCSFKIGTNDPTTVRHYVGFEFPQADIKNVRKEPIPNTTLTNYSFDVQVLDALTNQPFTVRTSLFFRKI